MWRWLRNLALLACSTLASNVVAELVLRIALPQRPSWLSVYRVREAPIFYGLREGASEVIDTGESRWTVTIDEAGFRCGPSRAVAPQGALFLGDSFTFGHGVDYEQSFVGLLAARDPSRRFLNAAVPGHGPIQYRAMLEDRLRQLPDIAEVFVVVYLGNDFHDCFWNKNLPVVDGALGAEASLRGTLKKHLHLYRLVSRIWHVVSANRETTTRESILELFRPASWQQGPLAQAKDVFQRECQAMQQACATRKVPLRFVLLPAEESLRVSGKTLAADDDVGLPAKVAAEVLQRAGVPFLDLTPRFQAEDKTLYFPIDRHLNPEGNRLVAEAVAEWRTTSR